MTDTHDLKRRADRHPVRWFELGLYDNRYSGPASGIKYPDHPKGSFAALMGDPRPGQSALDKLREKETGP